MHITIGGNRICYPNDCGTKTASLELVKLQLKSVLSRPVTKFVSYDNLAGKFYHDNGALLLLRAVAVSAYAMEIVKFTGGEEDW